MAPAGGAAAAAAAPRLVIKSMVLENFKSYAGEQTVGPFHQCFSSVVGPNGSGKSNVIDALLFVFGKRAKQLRLNKVSELIHNSTNFRNLEHARVTVRFHEIVDRGNDTYDVVPGSDLEISRVAYRNNSSKYFIGEATSNFTEVTDVLKGKGVDLDNNRFLILQGEVEQISMMKPKAQTPHDEGLLEYLEDIIGSNKYIERIDEGTKKLEAMNEERASQVQRLKVVEKDREALQGAKDEAEGYLQKERDLLKWKGVLYQLFSEEAKANVAKIEGSRGDLNAKLEHEREKHKEWSAGLKDVEARYNACNGEHETISKQLDAANTEFKAFEKKDIEYRESLKHIKQKAKRAAEKAEKEDAKVEELRGEIERIEAEVPQLDKKKAKAEAQLVKEEEKLEKLVDGVKDEVAEHGDQLNAVRKELQPLEARIADAQGKADVARAEHSLLSDKLDGAKTRLEEAREGKAAAESRAAECKAELKRAEAAIKEHTQKLEAGRKNEQAAQDKEAKVRASLQEVRGVLEQRRAAQQAEQTRGQLLGALMDAKQSGKIPGIIGRLGDLGAIDAKFDVAVSTAAGALDYIVVEDDRSAQACVDFLRKNKLGVATFLILDKHARLADKAAEHVSTPEDVPRLFDQIRVADERLKVAFYYALRDTVVATDLDQATRIAYSKGSRFRRVVTLSGQLIESSGTMSGGGAKPRGGRMRIGKGKPTMPDASTDKKAVMEAEKQMSAHVAELESAKAELAVASAQVQAAEKALAQLEVQVPKLRMEAESALEQAALLESRLGELETAAKTSAEDSAALKKLAASLAAAEKALETEQKGAAGLQAKAAELQAAIDNAGGEKLRKQRALVKELGETVEQAGADSAKQRGQASVHAKAVERAQASAAEAREEREALKKQAEETKAEFSKIEEAAFQVLETFKATQKLLDEKAEELAALRKEFADLQKAVGTIRTVEVDIQAKLDDLSKDLKDNNEKAKHWEKELAAVLKQRAAAAGEGAEEPALLTAEELAEYDSDKAHYEVTVLEAEITDLSPDMGAIEAYRKKEAEYAERAGELQKLTEERDVVRREHEQLRKHRLDDFMAGFNVISLKLKEMYQMITLGGDAELELVDSLDPFSEGIVFSVRPPKKSWKNISNLSGGEKTLSSLALVFALHHFKPTPLYVMDEIDAALDFKNVSIVAHYLKERTKDAQFVVISLRNNMFELADRLVGIYKTNNATKSVAINPGSFKVGEAASAAAEPAAAEASPAPATPAVPVA